MQNPEGPLNRLDDRQDLEAMLGTFGNPIENSKGEPSDSETLGQGLMPPGGRGLDLRLDLPHGFTLEDVEKAVVLQTLESCQGNRTRAARSLGISVRTLQRRLKRWQADSAFCFPAAQIQSPESPLALSRGSP